MSDKVVCRLRLTVTGALVDGQLEWQEEIWTEGVRRHMVRGADVRDYEAEMCALGGAALEAYAEQVEDEARARRDAQAARRAKAEQP